MPTRPKHQRGVGPPIPPFWAPASVCCALYCWAGAIADIDYLAKKAENPPWFKVGGNVQAEAIEIFAAKKKIQAQRDELRTFVQYSYGQSAWEELLRIEAQVRKRKQATDHRAAEIKEKLITIALVILVLMAGLSGLALLAYFLVMYDQR
jgi:hypothetical protein